MALVRNQRGVTYLMVMFGIVLMGVSLSVVGKQWKVVTQRDLEAELLFRGNRIKAAIEIYAADYEVRKASRPHRYPVSLEELTKQPTRYLQEVYKDPLTGGNFELIKVGAEIRGVRSRSKGKPFNTVLFKGARTYHDVAFQAASTAQPCLSGVNPVNQLLPSVCVPTGTNPGLPPGSASPSPSIPSLEKPPG